LPSPYEHCFLLSTLLSSASCEATDLHAEWFDLLQKVVRLPAFRTTKTRPRVLVLDDSIIAYLSATHEYKNTTYNQGKTWSMPKRGPLFDFTTGTYQNVVSGLAPTMIVHVLLICLLSPRTH